MSDVIFLSNVRLSFPHLTEPQKTVNAQTGDTRISYSANFLMPESHQGFQQFMVMYQQMIAAKFAEKTPIVLNMIQADRKLRCFARGEEIVNATTLQGYDGYPGNMVLTAGRATPPQLIQADGTPVDPLNTMAYQAIARTMYAGCRVNAAIKPWRQENKHGNGIRCDLIAIQFAGDDKPLGVGEIDVKGLFGAVAQTSSIAGMFGSPAPQVLPSFFK